MNKKYTIMTAIMDADYECVNEIDNPDPHVEYLMITRDKRLISKTWNVVYIDKYNEMSVFDALYDIKFNCPFQYASTDLCIQTTGNVKIFKSLDKLVNDFLSSNAHYGVMMHPSIHTFIPELQFWIYKRGYSVEQANKFMNLLKQTRYDINYKSYFQLAFTIQKKSKIVDDINRLVYSFLKYLGTDKEIERIDQTVFAFVLNTFFENMNLFLMHPQVLESAYMQRYQHNTQTPATLAGNIPYDVNSQAYGYAFNQLKPVYFLK